MTIRRIFCVFAALLLVQASLYAQKTVTEYHYKKLKSAEGKMVDGKKHGKWMYWDRLGYPVKTEGYIEGLLSGAVETYRSPGWDGNDTVCLVCPEVYKKALETQKKAHPLEIVASCSYLYGRLQGSCKVFASGKPVEENIFVLNNLVESKRWDNNGELIEHLKFLDGAKHGHVIEQLNKRDPGPEEGEYVKGLRQGEWTRKGEHLKTVSTYKDGKLHGKQSLYNYQGLLVLEQTYRNDTLHGPSYEARYQPEQNNLPTPVSETERFYRNGIEHGQTKMYTNGVLNSMYTKNKGNLSGPYAIYDPQTGVPIEKGINNGNSKSTARLIEGDSCYSYYSLGNISWERCYNAKKQKVKESLYDTLTAYPDHGYNYRLLQVTWWNNLKKIKEEKYTSKYKVVTTWNEKGKLLKRDTIHFRDRTGPGEPLPREPYRVVDVPAEYPGGREKMLQYLFKNMKYPQDAREQGIEGKVYLYLTVKKDGTVTDVEVVKGRFHSLDKEAVRLVRGMPKWKPGKLKGVAVDHRFAIPVQFMIQ